MWLTPRGERPAATKFWSCMNRLTYWGLPLTFAAFAATLSTPMSYAQSASKLYNQGRAAEARDDMEGAYEAYAKAYQKKPQEEKFKTSYFRLRLPASAEHVEQGDRLQNQGDSAGAMSQFLRALEIDPGNELATQEIRALKLKEQGEGKVAPVPSSVSPAEHAAQLDLGAPPELKPMSNEPMTIHSTEDVKVLYQTIGKLAGINVLFDPSYRSTRMPLDLANVSVYDALRILGTVSGTFWQPITSNTIFVAENTRGKRTELNEEAVQTFYLSNVSQQSDLNDVNTALRNVFLTAKLYPVPSQNAIIMRGTPDELMLAGKLISDLDKARPEVVVDVSVLEISRTKSRQIGIQLPQTLGVTFQTSNATSTSTTGSTTGSTSTTSSTPTLQTLAHPNSTNFAVSLGSAQVEALLTDSTTKMIQNPRLRATDGQEAQAKIGERLPVATGSYQAGVATAITSSLVNTQFQYLDIGVNIDMKPVIHYDNDVSMKLTIDISSTNGTENLGGIDEPIITQRKTEQYIRIPAGQSTVLGGILQRQKSYNLSGTPGLSDLPLIKYLFSTNEWDDTDDEIVFLITPHVVRAQSLSPLNLRQIDTGTTNDIQLRHVNNPEDQDSSMAAGANQNLSNAAQPNMPPSVTNPAAMHGSVPGQMVSPAAVAATSAPAAQQPTVAAGGGQPQFQLVASNPVQSIGNTFQEQVVLQGGQDVYSVPLQVQFDGQKLQLVNVDVGDLLGKDGQSVALVHRVEDGKVIVSTSRPPGVAGVSGSGTVCTLTFKAIGQGTASIALTQPTIRNSKQQAIPAGGAQGVVRIQ